MLRESEILYLSKIIDSEIDYFETCELPDAYCEMQIVNLKNLRKKITDLL